ncbi:MAG: hypothetical protein U9Q05_01445 [Thermodesulfobacteriota bacterium]|nr:hypothetical protein [Thermodesulfobacteriota bacterium]
MKSKSIAPNRKTEFRLFAGGMIVLMMIALSACQQEIKVPPDLIGVWHTFAPKYKDRYIEFTDNTLIFHIGNDGEIVHAINKMKFENENFLKLYTFYYQDSEGEKWTLSLSYDPDNYNGTISCMGAFQLENSNAFWRKCL